MKKILLTLFMFVLAAVLADAGTPETATPAAPTADVNVKERKMSSRKQNFLMWRAFSQLSDAERSKLVRLQREDPEKFRAALKEKAEALFDAEQKRHAELRRLIADYGKAGDEKTRNEIKARVRRMLAEDFRRHLRENTTQLKEMKRRAAELESELEKRAANADAAIDAQTEAALAGKFFPGDRPPPSFRDGRAEPSLTPPPRFAPGER